MGTNKRLQELFQLYLDSAASEKELEELFHFSTLPEYEAEFQMLFASAWNKLEEVGHALPITSDGKETARIINFPAQWRGRKRLEIGSSLRRKVWPWLAVAAGIIAVILLSVLFFPSSTNHVIVSTPGVTKDFAPGRKGAILTLSDGRSITLDNLHKGSVTRQGNTELIKSDNGELIYRESEDLKIQPLVYNTVSTPRGRHYQLTLPDGTRVWLNASSSITYPVAFTEKNRVVEISGEAYLEVARDKQKPFQVQLKDFKVEVFGTSFNINSYPDEGQMKTTLIEGSLEIITGDQKKMITPGQQAVIIGGSEISMVNNADLQQVLAWKNGFFEFDNADIRVVLRELSRWYDVDVSYEGTVPPRPIYGKMQRELYLSQVLNILKKLGVNYRIEDRRLIVTP